MIANFILSPFRDIASYFKQKNMDKSRLKNKLILVVLGLLLFLTSSHAGMTFFYSARLNIIIYLVLFVVLGLLVLTNINLTKIQNSWQSKKFAPPSTYVILIAIFTFLLAISFIFNKDKSGNIFTYLNILIVIFASFLVVSLLSFDEFSDIFLKFMVVISVVSLLFFTITVTTRVDFSTNRVLNGRGNMTIHSYFDIFYDFSSTYTRKTFPRIMGPFWEPGAFGTYLIIALSIDLIIREKLNVGRSLLFTLCLILTQSTAAYILFILVLIAFVYKKLKSEYHKFVFILGITFAFVFLLVFYDSIIGMLANVMPSIFEKLLGGESLFERLASPKFYLGVFNNNPLFGVGGKTLNTMAQQGVVVSESLVTVGHTSTYGYVLGAFGIVGLVYIFAPMIGIVFSEKPRSFFNKIILIVLMVAIFNKENQAHQVIPNLFAAYFVVNIPRKFKKLSEFKSDDAIYVKDFLTRKNENSVLARDLASSFITRGFALITGFILTPVLNRYFGIDESFGVWLVITSIATWILTFDFGLGNGLKNKIIEARENNDKESAKYYISSTYAATCLVALTAFLLGIILIFTLDLNKALSISSTIIELKTLRITALLVLLAICLELIFKNVMFIFQAYSRNAIASSLLMFSNILLILFAITYRGPLNQTRFIILGIVYIVAINIPFIIANIFVFTKKLAFARPQFKYVNLSKAKSVLTLSGIFFAVQIGNLLMFSTNKLFINILFGPAAVVDFEKYNKVFAFISTMFGVIVQPPIWVAVTKAFTQKKYSYIKKMQQLALSISLIFIFASIIVGLGLQIIFDVWLGANSIKVNLTTILIFIIFNTLYLLSGALIIISNGLANLKVQAISLLGATILKVPVTLLLKHIFPNIGWPIIVIYNCLAFIPMLLFMHQSNTNYIKRDSKKHERTQSTS